MGYADDPGSYLEMVEEYDGDLVAYFGQVFVSNRSQKCAFAVAEGTPGNVFRFLSLDREPVPALRTWRRAEIDRLLDTSPCLRPFNVPSALVPPRSAVFEPMVRAPFGATILRPDLEEPFARTQLYLVSLVDEKRRLYTYDVTRQSAACFKVLQYYRNLRTDLLNQILAGPSRRVWKRALCLAKSVIAVTRTLDIDLAKTWQSRLCEVAELRCGSSAYRLERPMVGVYFELHGILWIEGLSPHFAGFGRIPEAAMEDFARKVHQEYQRPSHGGVKPFSKRHATARDLLHRHVVPGLTKEPQRQRLPDPPAVDETAYVQMFEHERSAFEHMLPQLLTSRPGIFVAVHGGKVVDEDSDRFELAKRVDQKYGGQFVLIRQVAEQQPAVCHMDSPEVGTT